MAKGVDLKNSHNLKVMFYSGGEFLGLQETAPQVTLRENSEEAEGGAWLLYRSVATKGR